VEVLKVLEVMEVVEICKIAKVVEVCEIAEVLKIVEIIPRHLVWIGVVARYASIIYRLVYSPDDFLRTQQPSIEVEFVNGLIEGLLRCGRARKKKRGE
jgi:hypothetical protein